MQIPCMTNISLFQVFLILQLKIPNTTGSDQVNILKTEMWILNHFVIDYLGKVNVPLFFKNNRKNR